MSTPASTGALGAFKQVSTATLIPLQFKRGLRNTLMQGLHGVSRGIATMVGPACTLRYIPAREDLDHTGVFLDHGHLQRRAVEEVPPGQVLVMDSRGDATAVSAVSILITRMLVRGVIDVATDGGLRDSHEFVASVASEAEAPTLFGEFVMEQVLAGRSDSKP